jgi:hypothetical protein
VRITPTIPNTNTHILPTPRSRAIISSASCGSSASIVAISVCILDRCRATRHPKAQATLLLCGARRSYSLCVSHSRPPRLSFRSTGAHSDSEKLPLVGLLLDELEHELTARFVNVALAIAHPYELGLDRVTRCLKRLDGECARYQRVGAM